jgi:WD40 repeat protein
MVSLLNLTGHSDLVWAVAMSPVVATTCASAGQDGTVLVWDTRKSDSVMVAAQSHQVGALALAWHPQNEFVVATGLEDGSVWCLDTRKPNEPLVKQVRHLDHFRAWL